MPAPQEQKKSSPKKPGFFQKIFGSGEFSPDVWEAIRIAKQENPDLAPIEPYGLVSRLLQPSAMGYASPGRTIYLNPTQLQGQSVQDIADTITHEQTHIKQSKDSGRSPVGELMRQIYSSSGTPYHQREDEMAAFQAEKDRRNRMGRTQSATPLFDTGKFHASTDVYLRNEKR